MSKIAQPPIEDSGENEASRQAVHMLVGAFALLLRWLSYPQALACAVAAIVFNAFILPRLPGSRRRLYRAEERKSGFSMGILMYPVSVFALIFTFPVPVAASMWGALSFGDALSTLVGSRIGRRRLPWNRGKTLEGMLAFVVGALPTAAFLYWWTAPNVASSPPWWRSGAAEIMFGAPGVVGIVIITLLTAIASAFLETLKLGVDDNLVAPLGGACVMVGLLYVLF